MEKGVSVPFHLLLFFALFFIVYFSQFTQAQQTTCTTLYDSNSISQNWQTDGSSGASSIVTENSAAKLSYSNSNKAIFQVQLSNSVDLSNSIVQLEIKKVSGATSPDSVAIALITGSSKTWIEATPQSSSSTLLPFDVKSNNWKSESSGWVYSISVPNINQVSRIAVLLLSNSANTGALYLVSVKKCQATNVVTASPTASNTLAPSISSPPSSNNKAFVSRSGTSFSWGGCPFYYAGTNNYYMTYQSTFMVTDVLDSASKMGFNVIRVFSFIDRGSLSSSNVIDSPFYYQYWDTQTNAPAYNDGATGLERVDFIIAEAAKRGIKLILTFTNNWREFGGMDQYSKWYGLSSHSDFYTDSRVKNAYKSWISHMVNRKNTITGKFYKDDPTIFAWELANEPRCKGSGDLGVSSSCNTQTITSWANEMSTYTKSLDANHMVSVGDEGFFNQPGSSDWIYNGSEGVDFDALLALPNIDFGTFHLYPSHWGKSSDWGVTYINEHATSSGSANKPVIAEEFGYPNSNRASIYTSWALAIESSSPNLAGSNFWMIAARENTNGQLYPDYDGFTIYNDGSEPAQILMNHAEKMTAKNAGCIRTGVNDVDMEGNGSGSGRKWGVALGVIGGVAVLAVVTFFVSRKVQKKREETEGGSGYRKFEMA